MQNSFVTQLPLSKFSLWNKLKKGRRLITFNLEITARCNNNCRHCCINLAACDDRAKERELTFEEIKKVADQAVSLGALWCLLTGGEPLLRDDFSEIYLYLRRKGLLLSVFTNAIMINDTHLKLFKKYPPRDIEVTVYGITKQTYERVSRVPGSFEAFMHGVDLLLKNKIKVRFKAMALRSNINELPEIASFCRQITKDHFRFDPFLHLRYDGDPGRNQEIRTQRLSSKEIVAIEKADSERFQTLEKACDTLILPEGGDTNCKHLFGCGIASNSFSVSYDGFFRLCSSLWHSECLYDLRKGTLAEAWQEFVPRVRDMRLEKEGFLKKCKVCSIVNLCLWCPAHSHLENGEFDGPVDYFCEVAHARAKSFENQENT